jgi:hypothetical protein
MARTAHLDLPLIMPAQAQKHVTVNEALARLDATVQLRVISSVTDAPPAAAADGASYLIPDPASGEWNGRSGQVAVWSNGGWVYLAPRAGWRAWDEGRSGHHAFDGTAWVPDALVVSPNGAATLSKVIEFDHAVVAGATNAPAVSIPSHSQVVGVTGRVLNPLTGPGLTGWRVGVAGSDDRYGSGLGLAAGSYLLGLSGAPVTYYGPTPLVLTAEGGQFAAGDIRLALHVVQLAPPRGD